MRTYRDPAIEADKKKRRAAVVKRYSRREDVEDLSCSVCGKGILHVVRLGSCKLQFCDEHFRDFSDRASSLVEDMRNAGIQHPDQGKFPERLAAGLRQSEEQSIPVPVQVHEADGTGPESTNASGESV